MSKKKHKKPNPNRPTKLDKRWKQLTTGVLVVLVVFFFLGRILIIRGESMEPTYHNGNVLIGLRVFNYSKLAEKDFPVCVVQLDGGLTVIKRLVGRPGDKVDLLNGDTYVNDELIMKRNTPSWDNYTYQLGEDEWLFLGDNRAESADGRYWPGNFVSSEHILYWVPGSELVLNSQ